MSDALFLQALAPDGSSDPSLAPAELPRQGRLVIGSSKERSSYHLTGQGVADVHCTIGRLKSGGWALKDLGSDFGTMVNGKRVDATKLAEGDEILVGSRKLRVYSTASGTDRRSASAPKRGPAAASRKTPAKGEPAKQKAAEQKAAEPKPAKKAPAARPKTRELGGYRLERPLGRGAMGDVYLALQTSLDRRVALKVLKSALAKDATFVERFKDEARAAARLNHPNIVTIFDVGEEGGQHFLSMEYMDGSSLEEHLKKAGPMPWREALEVMRDAAAGLVYAETSGIVHRDIKPENLMRNKDGVTKIADLGLAAQVEQEGVDAGSGKVFGTPHFLAPEVVRGAPATPRSDLYSLGATAFRILSGRTPFEGRDAREILRSALQDEAPALTALVPGIPAAMAATVHRLLARDPEERHPSASVLLAEIERLRQSGGQVGGAEPVASSGGGLPKPLLIGGGLLVLAGAAAVLFGGGGSKDPVESDSFARRTSSGDGAGAAGSDETGDADVRTNENGSEAVAASSGAGATSVDSVSGAADGQEEAGGAEATYEYRASVAYLELGDEALATDQRVARLRALSEAFAGTDTAVKAAKEADEIEAAAIREAASEASSNSLRTAAIEALRTAAGLESDPFLPGAALRAVQAVPSHASFAGDLAFESARNELIGEIMTLGLNRGRSAMEAADEAVKAGSYEGTKAALNSFLMTAEIPGPEEAPILAHQGIPSSVLEYQTLVATVQSRFEALADGEAEFAANLLRKERAAVSSALRSGPQGGLEGELRSFKLSEAAERLAQIVSLTTEEPLRTRLAEREKDLRAAASALDGLIQGWDSPGWRRRSVIDPRPGASGSVEIVGVNEGSLSVQDGGATLELAFANWSGSARALENLFLGRLERDWTAEESRGIATLLSISATLETLAKLDTSLGATPMRVAPADPELIVSAFAVAQEWARGADEEFSSGVPAGGPSRTLAQLVESSRDAAIMLTKALIARDEGEWGASAAFLRRLLEERRDSWLTLLLSRVDSPGQGDSR